MRLPVSVKRLQKRFLYTLIESQKEDKTVPAHALLAARHLFRRCKYCVRIPVVIDEEAGWCEADRNTLPKFITSQLDTQKLTDHSCRCIEVPSQVSKLIDFILEKFSRSEREPGYPTLFHWYSPLNHRTYFIFARIRTKLTMTHMVYTVEELLAFREPKPKSGRRVVPVLSSNPVFADIVRDSSSESSDFRPSAVKHKNESSVSSEEVLFKGIISRRAGQERTRETIREPIREIIREPVHEPIHQSIRSPAQETVQDLPQHHEWKYHGRSESEAAIGEPVSAPTGIPAQRSEGFQRFYKAVVSPTHVRVTAGGRIVPNTRGPPSPTSKRSKDTPADSQGTSEKAVHGTPSMLSLGHIGLNQQVPVVPQFITGYPGFQSFQAPMGYVPIPAFGTPMGPGFHFSQPAVNPATAAQATSDSTLKDTHNTKPGETRDDNAALSEKQEKVKLAPPELFDYTKPFFYNGQYIYPIPAPFPPPLGSSMMPVQMVGIPPGGAPQIPGPVMQPAPNGAGPATSTTPFAPITHSTNPTPVPPSSNIPANVNFKPSVAPPISSIKPSDITKKQINTFKQSLKYHEDQLQYNRHQIDEAEMETRIRTLRTHIATFEKTLKTQLEYEDSVRRQGGHNKDDVSSQTPPAEDVKELPQLPTTNDQPDRSLHEEKYWIADKPDVAALRRRTTQGRLGLNSNIGEGGKAVLELSPEPAAQSFSDFLKKSGLPSDAALAPEFQPRGYASTWTGPKHSKEASAESTNRLYALAGLNPPVPKMEDQRAGSQSYSTSIHESSHYLSKSSSSSSGRVESRLGVPYLLGSLPKGVDPRTAKEQDYVYSRPLTDDERRARFLYWGKAPKSVLKGLPRYDGKHFYPPSPGKTENTPSTSHATSASRELPVRRVPISRPDNDFEFRGTKSEADPFRPITPVHKAGFYKAPTVSEDGYAALRHASSYDPQAFSKPAGSGDDYGALRHASSYGPQTFQSEILKPMSEDAESEKSAVLTTALKSHENSADAVSVGSHDRQSSGASSGKLWPMFKKATSSSAVSSTTAQGYLPPFAGHAAASLSPTVSKNSPIRNTSPEKMSGELEFGDGGALLTLGPETRRENLPPHNVGSLEDQFKNITLDASERRDLNAVYKI
ncbi:hypothetical protein B0H67DRAFT_613345 [Lasiosphaeris hirsuta]|uniref:Uncharacterized protein n=1 Tax=Lasiosphaeris hirsuta TaxID=260670 RepID=A0AA39ZW48_9PEZI|nr:hypothetical protein B0H67DRAFT_613345 [Lasiosphaeris hirsuta]